MYVFLVWVLLGAMMVGILHAAKTLVQASARVAASVAPAQTRTLSQAPVEAAVSTGLGAPDRASAARSSSWPAPATNWSP